MIAYTTVDGIPNYRNSEISALYERAVAEGAGHVFRDGTIRNAEAFACLAQGTGVAFFVLYVRGQQAGVCWLNRFQGRFAQLHFFTFQAFWGKDALGLGRYVLHTLLYMTTAEGDYLLDMVVGLVPAGNRLAVSYAQRCGGRRAGVLPLGSLDAATGRSGPAVVITVTRENV